MKKKMKKKSYLLLKKKGINSGVIVQIDNNKYYIKTFHEKNKKKNSQGYESLNLLLKFKGSSLVSEEEIVKLRINLIEPLLYFIFEELKYGPKVEIIINPYVSEGLYIISKDIEENGKKFYLFKDINDKIENNILSEKDLINNQDLVISLNEIDIISKIFNITDLNYGNFGFLEEEKNENNYKDIKIIDFVALKNNFHISYNDLISRQNDGVDLSDKNIIKKYYLFLMII